MSAINNSLLMSIPTAILHTAVIPYLSPIETEKLSAVSRAFRSGICANEALWQQKVIYQVGAEKVKKYLKLYERYEKSWYKLSIVLRTSILKFNPNSALEQGEFRNSKLHGWGKRNSSWISEEGLFQDGHLVKGIKIERLSYGYSEVRDEGQFEKGLLSGLGKRFKFDRNGNFWYKEEGIFINGDPDGICTRSYCDGKVKEVKYKDGEYGETVKFISDSRRNRCLIM